MGRAWMNFEMCNRSRSMDVKVILVRAQKKKRRSVKKASIFLEKT